MNALCLALVSSSGKPGLTVMQGFQIPIWTSQEQGNAIYQEFQAIQKYLIATSVLTRLLRLMSSHSKVTFDCPVSLLRGKAIAVFWQIWSAASGTSRMSRLCSHQNRPNCYIVQCDRSLKSSNHHCSINKSCCK